MKNFTDEELIALGLQIQEARSKGGKTILKKFGPGHFSKLGKISQAKRKERKNKAILLS